MYANSYTLISCMQLIIFIFQIQSTIVPEVVLKEWAQRTYQDSAEYWTFRKQVSSKLVFKCNVAIRPKILTFSDISLVHYAADVAAICRVHPTSVKAISRDVTNHSHKRQIKCWLL